MIDSEPRIGRVVAVSLSDTKSYPKFPQNTVTVGQYGFEGDAHSGELRTSHNNPGTFKPNDRAVSIVGKEVLDEVNASLDLNVQPGGFNENILIYGLGDLSDLSGGEQILFSGGVVLQVTGQNPPCVKLEAYNGKGMIKATIEKDDQGRVVNKRGVVATVLVTGKMSPGEEVSIQR